MSCLVIKPAVDRLQLKLTGRYRIIRINIHSEFGTSLARKYLTGTVPSFLVFDNNGKEVKRFHRVPEYEFLLDVSKNMSKS